MENLQAYFNVRDSLLNFLIEDIGTGDITSNTTVSPSTSARAQIVCKTEDTATVCGLKEAGMIFDICDCRNRTLVKDGTIVDKQTIVMDITGKALSILKAERTALNLIMRMSGIATETRKFVDAVNRYKGSVRIACTRKTVPGLRFFDKKAVSIGGGETHRMALDDMVLIKDNHIFFSESVEKSVKLARQNLGSSVRVECEVTTLNSAIAAINAGADIIMLDNFSPSDVSRTIKEITKKGIRKRAKLEISGGISLQNVKSYAKSRPDIISIGRLTHSPEAINFSLEMIEKIRS
jgi:nicotinate-nucleotide pyrophosphorylase (carboxylating)